MISCGKEVDPVTFEDVAGLTLLFVSATAQDRKHLPPGMGCLTRDLKLDDSQFSVFLIKVWPRARESDRIGGDFRELRDRQPAFVQTSAVKGSNSRPAA
jgi:hypothetical protein